MTTIFQDNDTLGQKVILRSVKKFMTINSIITATFVYVSVNGATAPVVIPELLTWLLPGNKTFKKSLPIYWDFFMDQHEYFYQIFVMQQILLILFSFTVTSLIQYEYLCTGFIIGEFHQLQVFEQLYKLNSPVMFVVIVGASCCIILSGTTMVVLMNSSSAIAIKMLIVYCTALITVPIACIPSQLLSNACLDMFNKTYCINWYEYPPTARRILVLFLLRSMKTMVFEAGKIIELNFETCSNVLSYFINWYKYPPKARLIVVLLLLRSMKTLVVEAGSIIQLNFETCSNISLLI
ncbi:uncharacterized protein LOC106653113 [Trichogramma pretiosum]|uniref:uncharacterized protein LOC106653113 n=1 Tax=Trichogramma pretiosum TaxID=7493 RepID=UPI0006C98802|nr:uncharacterized protein LOC106653113 [Trichogramma pretiosum]